MKKTRVLMSVLALLLFVSGCAGNVTTTTTSPTTSAPTTTATSPATTNAPTTTTASSTSTTGTSVSAVSTVFTAELSGKEVVPALDTTATGSATFTVDPTSTRVDFVLKVSGIADVTGALVREGKPGANGQGLLILFPGPTKASAFTGVLSSGNFSASALLGSLAGKTIADLVALIHNGQVYVNVGTVKNPKGELRGQVH